MGKPGPKPRPPEERFWAKVNKNGPLPERRPELGPCWLWIAHLIKGYGRFSLGSHEAGNVQAHRYAWELLIGPIPEGLTLDHLCRNRACVKVVADEHGPAHLEPVTHAENLLRGDGVAGTNARKAHCPKGHPYDEANTRIDRTGRRFCRACARERMNRKWCEGPELRERQRERRARKRGR